MQGEEEPLTSMRDLDEFLDDFAILVASTAQSVQQCSVGDRGFSGPAVEKILKIESELKVRDKKDGNFYKCKVIAVKGGKCKVHFVGWKTQYDEWIAIDSDSLLKGRPYLVLPKSHSAWQHLGDVRHSFSQLVALPGKCLGEVHHSSSQLVALPFNDF